MGRRYLLGFILSLFLGIMIIPPLLMAPPTKIAKNCTSIACPLAKQLIKKVAPELKNKAYTLYVANFSAGDVAPIPISDGTTPILWLGGYSGIDLSRLRYYKIILTTTPLLRDVLRENQFNAYYLPLFSLTNKESHQASPQKFIALINHPQKIEAILQDKNIPYRHYTTEKAEEILRDMRNFKAAFVENTAFNKESLDIHPIFLTLAEHKIPLACYWGWPNVEENINMFNDTLNFYITETEIESILNSLQNNSNVINKRKEDIFLRIKQYHTLEAATSRLKYILQKHQEPTATIPANSLNIDSPVSVGHTTSGDYGLAKNLEQELDKYGYRTSYSFYNSLYKYTAETNIIMRGVVDDKLSKIGKINILYLAYPQFNGDGSRTQIKDQYYEEILPLLKGYDAVATASKSLSEAMTQKGLLTTYIPQFTDTTKFYPEYNEGLKSDVLFVGIYAPYRRAPQTIINAGLPITIYGPKWQGFAKEDHLEYKKLNQYYSSAKIVLNDTRSEMILHGVISNRIFDATACETLVISDYMPEIEEVYGDSVPMWKSEEELVALVKYYLAPEHEEERKEKAKRAREITLKNFTAEMAAKKFHQIITEIKHQKGK